MKTVADLSTLAYILLWTEKLKASQILFNPLLPKTFIKPYTYSIEMFVNEKRTNISYYTKPVSGPRVDILEILNNILKINTKYAITANYKYQIFYLSNSHPSDEYTAIEFFVVHSSEIKNNIADSYIVENDNFLFQLKLFPKELDISDFTIGFEFDKKIFFYQNYSIFVALSIIIKDVYPITISINYTKLSHNIFIDKLTTFVFFPVKIRNHMTDLEMDKGTIKSNYEVDYNDYLYQNTVPDELNLTAIPNVPNVIDKELADAFNIGTPIFKYAGLVMFMWIFTIISLIVLTVVFGRCQNYFWVPTGREIVKINPFGGPHPPDTCYLDFWLQTVGHAENRRHCFAEIWEETFNELFPVGICSNCMKNSAKLIFEDRLQELVTLNSAAICINGDECRFPYFQCHLRIHNERIPGFECESCSKEAYITILKWAV